MPVMKVSQLETATLPDLSILNFLQRVPNLWSTFMIMKRFQA